MTTQPHEPERVQPPDWLPIAQEVITLNRYQVPTSTPSQVMQGEIGLALSMIAELDAASERINKAVASAAEEADRVLAALAARRAALESRRDVFARAVETMDNATEITP